MYSIWFLLCSTTFGTVFSRNCFESPNHCPFNDLSGFEIQPTVELIKNSGIFLPNATLKFPTVRVKVPDKEQWLNGITSINSRVAYAAVFDLSTSLLVEFDVDLNANSILSTKFNERGTQPTLLLAEYAEAEKIIQSDPRYEQALKRHGINNIEYVKIEIWTPGPLKPTETSLDQRLVRAIFNYQDPKTRFSNYRVIEGLLFTVDLNSNKVVEIVDNELTKITSVMEESDFSNKPKLKPIITIQPEGSSFKIHGQQIEWYKWKFMYNIDPISGLQLYHVNYNGDCCDRLIIYKMGLTEMFVPYGEKKSNWRWRSPFDGGEYGIGINLNPLKIGLDVPKTGVLINCTLADEDGMQAKEFEGCVGIYEKETGLLYKHSTLMGDIDVEGRTGRVLIVTLMTTGLNYDYTYDYIFHMDGTIDIQSRLTGILLARGVHDKQNPMDCTPESCVNYVNDYLIGPTHQHWFNYRIDFDIDGTKNWVVEENVEYQPYDPIENADNSAFSASTKLIANETFRDYNFQSNRNWHIINRNSRNLFNTPRGYAIMPGTISYPFISPTHPFFDHANFIRHPIWFTKYHEDEQYSTSKFPRRAKTGVHGLLKHIENKENLEGEDVVAWFTFGVTHSTRPEEWPLLNVHQAGFKIMPFNFLSQNSEMPLKDRCP